MKSFNNKVAVITGAGGGIGGALSKALAQRGCHLALVDYNPDMLEKTVSTLTDTDVKLSMHIADVGKGNLGANGIVGGGIPIAVGAALAAKRLGTKAVTVCFFGDGANNEGAFHEALNIASVWKLPVVFVCENNKYGMSTSTERSTAVKQIATRAIAYDMPGESVDGNDFSSVAQAVDHAVKRARNGDGPSLIENITYRWRGHSRSDRNRYRTKEEISAWQEKDPIERMRLMLTEHGIVDADKIETIELEVEQIIEAAITFAVESPDPLPDDATNYVYTDHGDAGELAQ